MKAAICTKYGPPEVVKIQDIKKPVPKDDEILIKNHATVVSTGDARMRAFDVPTFIKPIYRPILGLFKPRNKIFGFAIAGEVESVGKKVTKFKKGDRVLGATGLKLGAHVEYKCLKEDGLIAAIPKKLSCEDVAPIPFGASTSLHYLRAKGDIKPGQKVLIVGSTGSLGVTGIQLAKHFGAEVTAVCSAKGAKLAKKLGADHIVDYKKDDLSGFDEEFDLVYDTLGYGSFTNGLNALKPGGYYLRAVNITFISVVRSIWTNLTSKKKVVGGVAKDSAESISYLCNLMAKGELKPVIDSKYPFAEIAKAYKRVDSGHKKGDVVLKFNVTK